MILLFLGNSSFSLIYEECYSTYNGCLVWSCMYCEIFLTRLWDHLASNSDLHLQSQDSEIEDVSKRKTTSGDLIGKSDSYHLSSEPEREKSNNKVTRSRHNREWKGLARDEAEPPPFRSSEIGDIHVEDKSHSKVSRAKSPSRQSAAQRKRIRSDERHNTEV